MTAVFRDNEAGRVSAVLARKLDRDLPGMIDAVVQFWPAWDRIVKNRLSLWKRTSMALFG